MRYRATGFALIVGALVGCPDEDGARPGDTRLSGPGYSLYSFNHLDPGSTIDKGFAIATCPAGGVLVAGVSGTVDASQMALLKLDRNGFRSKDFTTDGLVLAGGGLLTFDTGRDIFVDGSGSITVAGNCNVGGKAARPRVWAFSASGMPDPRFSANTPHDRIDLGPDAGRGFDTGSALAVTRNRAGDYFVVGQVGLSSNILAPQSMFLWKLDPAGNIDGSFGQGGLVLLKSATGSIASGSDVVVDQADRIVVIGEATQGENGSDMCVWRFLPSGNLDATFAASGIFTYNGTNASGLSLHDYGYATALDARQNIVVAGRTVLSGAGQATVWRLTAEGVLDKSFADGGRRILNPEAMSPSSMDIDVAIDTDGTLFVASQTASSMDGPVDLAVWALRDDGSFRTDFHQAGVFVYRNPGGGAFGRGVTLDPSYVWVTGFMTNSSKDQDLVVLRIDK